ncbi:MAG: sel1 repeat family protein, partial [Muribaculaceae bacterium]|nr:sel1 repeat family protein [Muribaculaceae bacterium]
RAFRKAAEHGHAEAQYNLGVMYIYGDGVAQNDTEAARWLRKAAAQGYDGVEKALKNLKFTYSTIN